MEEQRRATLADGQDAGRMLLEIEARIGELSEHLQSKGDVRSDGKPYTPPGELKWGAKCL